jgi:transposase
MLARMSALSACRLGRGIRPCWINTGSTKPNSNASTSHFPLSHSRLHGDDRRVISGLVHVIRNGLRWRDAPEVYGPQDAIQSLPALVTDRRCPSDQWVLSLVIPIGRHRVCDGLRPGCSLAGQCSAPLVKCGLETRLELVWGQTIDGDAFATTGGAANDFESRTWHVEHACQESQ